MQEKKEQGAVAAAIGDLWDRMGAKARARGFGPQNAERIVLEVRASRRRISS